jgi:hypothetical protein
MKYVFVLLVLSLFAVLAFGQQQIFQYKPVVGSATIDSAKVTSASTTIKWARFDSYDTAKVVVGLRIQGKGIPYGATISRVVDTGDTLVISAAATESDGGAAGGQQISIGYLGSAAYGAGETLGWPFICPSFRKIYSVTIVDDAKSLATSVTAAFFSRAFTPVPDTVAWGVSDADLEYFQGLMTMSVINSWGLNLIMTPPVTALPIYTKVPDGQRLYCQLVAGGTGTFTAIDNVTVTIVGE